MSLSYDVFTGSFLSKISEYEFSKLITKERTAIVDNYMKKAISSFKKVCGYDLTATANDDDRVFDLDIAESDIDELADIISEGMVIQWLKPFLYRQEILENTLNTRDFTTYSPAELLMRIGNAYKDAKKDYEQMVREYSYNHADLTELHM